MTEDLIAREDMVVTLSHTGYIKSQPLTDYRAQKRGGRGKQAAAMREDDWIDQLFIANTHDTILCFSNRGRLYWLKVLGSAAGRAHRARQADRQHVPAGRGREDHRRAADLGVRRAALRLHGDRDGHGQEDGAHGFQQPAQGRHHRGRPRSGRLPDRRRDHRRPARRDAVLRCGQGGALRRERRAADGPHRAWRARHAARRRPAGDRDAGGRGRSSRAC